jgi:hypothetical protein
LGRRSFAFFSAVSGKEENRDYTCDLHELRLRTPVPEHPRRSNREDALRRLWEPFDAYAIRAQPVDGRAHRAQNASSEEALVKREVLPTVREGSVSPSPCRGRPRGGCIGFAKL